MMHRAWLALPVCVLVVGAAQSPCPTPISWQPRQDLEAGRYLKALWDADARLRANDKDALAWAIKAQALAALVRMEEAGRAAEWSLRLQPGLADGLLARGMVRAGQAIQQRNLSSLSLVRAAMKDLRDAVAADATLTTGWMLLGLGYQQLPGLLGGSVKQALNCADRLRQVNPSRGDLLAGTILANEKRYGEAEPLLRRAIEAAASDPQVVAGYLEVLASREVRDQIGAGSQKQKLAAEAARLLPLAKGKSRALQAISDAYLDADQSELAWKVAKEGLAGASAPSLLRFQLGKVAARAGVNREEGLAALNTCLKESLEGGIGGYQAVHWRRAQILKDLGQREEARGAVREVLRLDPNHRQAQKMLEELG